MTVLTQQAMWRDRQNIYFGDRGLIVCTLLLLGFGLVMMTSASIEIASSDFGDPFYYLKKQIVFTCMGGLAGLVVFCIPMRLYREWSMPLMFVAIGLLILVLIPRSWP